MALDSRANLGPYSITGLLGTGGMGEVYRAVDTRLGREIAIKILSEEFSRDAGLRARFEQEARAASLLSHPNIVCVHDVGQENGTIYIVSELVDGESLRSLISRGPVAPRKILEIGKQIADGLAAAHSAGIVHRDLKPENVLITRDGRVKIIDFGLAKRTSRQMALAATSNTLTLPGTVIGTVGYMSPEQVRAQDLDLRTDIFSLGVILYEMAAGRSAFAGDSAPEIMTAILKEEPRELENANIPPGLESIIRRCLEKDPARRFQTASDLAFAIGNVSGLLPAAKPVPDHRLGSLAGLAWAAAIVCVAAAITYWIGSRPHSEHSAAQVAVAQPAQTVLKTASEPPAATHQPKKHLAQAIARTTPLPSDTVHEQPKAPPSDLPDPSPVDVKPGDGPIGTFETFDPRAAQLVQRGQQFNQNHQFEEALDSFGEAIRLRPDYPIAYVGRGNAYFFLRQFDRALEDYNQAIKRRPGFAIAYDCRGRVFMRQRALDRALQDFDEAIRLNTNLAIAYNDRGRVYIQRGEYQRAIEDLDQALAKKPDLVAAFENRATAKRMSGDNAGAAADEERATQLRQQSPREQLPEH